MSLSSELEPPSRYFDPLATNGILARAFGFSQGQYSPRSSVVTSDAPGLETMASGTTPNPQAMSVFVASNTAGICAAPSDDALVKLLRDGDAAAGETLVKRHHVALLRYLRRLAGSDPVAEELHQQTWLAVLEHLDKYVPAETDASGDASRAGGFKPWLFRIATNKANDRWRSGTRQRTAIQAMRDLEEPTMPAASDRLERGEQEMKLQRAVAQLPEPQRQVLLMRYYGELKFVEIARILGCPLNTALGRMHKAMLKLKQLMDGG